MNKLYLSKLYTGGKQEVYNTIAPEYIKPIIVEYDVDFLDGPFVGADPYEATPVGELEINTRYLKMSYEWGVPITVKLNVKNCLFNLYGYGSTDITYDFTICTRNVRIGYSNNGDTIFNVDFGTFRPLAGLRPWEINCGNDTMQLGPSGDIVIKFDLQIAENGYALVYLYYIPKYHDLLGTT